MKLTNFRKFPCRFKPEEDDAAELLGLPSSDSNYIVNDIWIDLYKICAFSKHDIPNCTWLTMDSGLGIALDMPLEKFLDAIKDTVTFEHSEEVGKVLDGEAAFLLDQAVEEDLKNLENEAEDENKFFKEDDGPQEIDPED